MSFRIEDKLYIKSENLADFKYFLSKIKAKTLHMPRKIKSLYFDNINLEMYKDSLEGSVPRKKIRIREYPNSNDNQFYFEIKTSSVEGRFKKRKVINEKEYNEFKNYGILDNQYGSCLPTYYVSYLREYISFGDVRISIDTGIKYKNYKTGIIYDDDRKIIVELKTSVKKNIDDLVKDFPFQKIRFSKYCFAVESLN